MVAALGLGTAPVRGADAGGEPLARLRVFGPVWPRVFFFRTSEGRARSGRLPYEAWEAEFERLMGIEGKVLDEEIPGTSERNVEFFTRFKARHPDQLVLVHYNGRARDPRYEAGRFFAGHWLYQPGTAITADVPAEGGETDIQVADASIFRMEFGVSRKVNDEIGLCMVDEAGRPDWHRSEQVRLLAIHADAGTIRVERGYVGTTPRAFPAERARAAPHIHQGPCGRRSNLMWNYNYSSRCPRDAQGRTCADVLLQSLVEQFGPGGPLAGLDGVQFDVLMHHMDRQADCDADGVADEGIFNGVNDFGLGVTDFCRRLREALGEDRLILADGAFWRNQRAFGLLNGIESEGWPDLRDPEIHEWSGGLNRHLFWAVNGRAPILNYINHKFPAISHGGRGNVEIPWRRHRLVFAAALFTDAAICTSWRPGGITEQPAPIWDEFVGGDLEQLGWLGQPLGPPRRLALDGPDLIEGAGSPPTGVLAARVEGDGVSVRAEDGALRIGATDPSAGSLRVLIPAVPVDGPDLFVSLRMRGQPMEAYPADTARMAWVGIFRPEQQLVRSEAPQTGMAHRGEPETTLDANTMASVRYRPSVTLDGEARVAYATHPPGRGRPGYTFWSRDVRVPDEGRLVFDTGMGERAPGRSDGVLFRVEIAPLVDGRPGPRRTLLEHSQVEARWVRHTVPLGAWAGREVRLRFVADCGPNNDTATDHAHWGEVWVLGPENPVPPNAVLGRFMTWVTAREFTSGFYFGDVRAPRVDLTVEIEGSEPVWITALSAHAAPDLIAREYEHGAVLANPSRRAQTFDMNALFPGRTFRRLRATAGQDAEANDGSAVGERLTLAERAGLFLRAE